MLEPTKTSGVGTSRGAEDGGVRKKYDVVDAAAPLRRIRPSMVGTPIAVRKPTND